MRLIKNKSFVFGLMLALILVMLVGCGTKTETPAADAPAAEAPQEKPFYEGKTITMIVPHGAGGGYDTYARMLVPYLEKYLPGATIIVDNVTGAGGNVGRSKLWALKPDGLSIGLTSGSAMIYSQVTGSEGVQYDVTKWTYLGRILGEPSVLVLSSKSNLNTVDDFLNLGRPIKFAVSGVGDDDFFALGLAAAAMDFEVLPVTGYDGTKEGSLAIIRGEVDAFQTSVSSMLPLIQNGDVKPLLVYNLDSVSELPDVPGVKDFVKTDTGKDLMNAIIAISSVNRILFAPPGMDPKVAETLQTAFQKAMEDPELIASAQQAGRPLNYLSGAEVTTMVNDSMTKADLMKPELDKILKLAE